MLSLRNTRHLITIIYNFYSTGKCLCVPICVKASFHWVLSAAKSWNELANILCLNLAMIVFDIFRINFYSSFHYIALVFWVQ